MRGSFTTTMYESRERFEAREPNGIHVVSNSFVTGGLQWMWEMMLGRLRGDDGGLTDHLGNARIVVGDGTGVVKLSDQRLAGEESAQAEMDAGFPSVQGLVQEENESFMRLALRATFMETEANFDWRERGVVTSQGVLLDRAVGDQGRKPLGSIWTTEAALDLVP